MNLLFEDDGRILAGLILSETDASAQVELPGGRRIKVKGSNVLLHFAQPAAADLMAAAMLQRADIDMALLWESAAGTDEFSFGELATEYFGAAAGAVHQGATLLALQQAQMYFYKRGKGVVNRIEPGEVATVKIETPFNAKMKANNYNFTHANGTIKPHAVPKLMAAGDKEPAAKPASATKKKK